ncbi:MAG TPA: serine/threonine-protein kinase, partial [Planctomycetaceae bacterium]|nr:serine/threonine-protein kinase [Planctomycetaceae bacterium]
MTITQPTTTSNTSADATANSATCFSVDELREYLSGWSDDARAAAIESHLLACSNCERTLQELENKPDTLWQSLQGTTVARSVSDRDPSDAELVLNAANRIARSEIDAMREGSRPETGRATETDRATEAALEKVKQLMDVPNETAAEKDKAAWQPANRELGVYELLKPLGRGGMGAVYLANHRQLKKQVAIKLLPIMSAEDSDVRARFQREIRVVGRLNHPSIVAATDAGEIDGTQFLVMEYVPGLDLSRLARLLGKLPVADACELIRQVALGLSCAHAEGVVHRDVKPSNLMLDETGHIRILDFGLAQLSFWDEASVDLTTVGQLMGTLDYMAPEQAEFGGNVDYRADLYALGATLFRLLCGRAPLAAAPNQSPLEKLRLLANHQPPRLDTLCPEAPAELVALVGSLLSRSPQDRPASAAHVAEQLTAFTENADLVGLLRNAKEKAAASPELLNAEKPGWPQKPGFLEKPGFYPPSPAAESNGSRRGKKIRNWFLAAALPLLLIAGILIKLETDKGQLVIESDIDNIKVQIVSNGKPVSGLTINHGTTATRLRADKYEVTIDGPSDGLTIENEQFTIKSGETVVARIKYATTKDSSHQPARSAIIPAASLGKAEPLYEGKTLSEWLEMLSRERSPTGLKSALDACAALVSPETSERITQTILKTVRGLDGTTNLTPGQVDGRSLLDHEAEHVLSKANPGAAFYELWVKEFDTADEKWRERLWSYLYHSEIDEKPLEPFVVWVERRLKNGPTGNPSEDEVTLKTASYLRDIVLAISRNHAPQAVAADDSAFDKRVFTALKSCPLLDSAWWLSRPLVYRNSSNRGRTYTDQNTWPAGIKSGITRVAIATLQSDDSTPGQVAQACMILAHGANLDADARSQVVTAANRRLTALCANPETLRARVTTNVEFASFLAPDIQTPFGPPKSIFQFNDSTTAYLAMLYLDVVKSLNGCPDVSQGLSDVLSQVQPSRDLLITARGKSKSDGGRTTGNSPFRLQLIWPDLTIVESGESFGFNARSVQSMVVRTIWGISDPTFTNWFDFCILQHPVMQDYLASIETPADNAQPAEAEKPAPMSRTQKTPTSPATEPVFDGKTLSQWLSVIQTERSPEAFLSALKACSALTTPETAGRITELILKVLPTWPAHTAVGQPGTWTMIDDESFSLLAKANPGRKYYELLVIEYGNPDAEWRKRLATQIRRGDYEKFESVEPLLSWAEQTVQDSNTKTITPQDLNDAASFLTTFIERFPDNKAFVDSAVAALADCKALQAEWWMARPVALRDFDQSHIGSAHGLWPAALHAAVASQAIKVLEDPMAAENLVAQALMILSNAEDLTPDQKTKILSEVNRRLIKAAQSPELLVHMIDVDPSFTMLAVPHQKPATEDGVNSHSPKQISWGFSTADGNAKASITLELLDLFHTLQAESPPKDGLKAIATALADVESLDFESFTYS